MVSVNESGNYDKFVPYTDETGSTWHADIEHEENIPDYAGEPIFETENDLYEWRLRELRRVLGREES
jgi:hypothetical protein